MMVELKREAILAQLAVVLDGIPRNNPIGDVLPGAAHRALHDGEADLVDELINPPIYEWTITPAVMLVIAWEGEASPDATLAAEIEAVATALAGVTDLGGLITAIRPQAPDFAPKALWGAPNFKGAEVPIEIDYWSETSLG